MLQNRQNCAEMIIESLLRLKPVKALLGMFGGKVSLHTSSRVTVLSVQARGT